MRNFSRALLCGIAMAALTPFVAQAQVKPSETVASIPARVATYSASIAALVPAASTTDFFTLTGSATTVVRIKSVDCSGSSTANASNIITALLRSTADLTGTSTAPVAVPNDSSDGAATAVVAAYTANPGTLGTLVGAIHSGRLTTTTVATSSIETTPPLLWQFGTMNDKEPTLRGVTQVFALNGAATSFSAGTTLSCNIEWTESGT
jgi:hypothetical protein